MTASGDQVQATIHRFRFVLLALYSIGLLAILGRIASRRLFWYDESFTLSIASLPTPGAIWNALARGAENQPPLNFWLVHFASFLSGPLELATRIPSIGAFWLMTLCLYRAVARETNATYGFMAMLIPIAAPSLFFAYEARSYAPLMLFAAASVVSWQMAKAGEYRPWSLILFCLSLAAAVYSHYYGILVFVPFVLTELALGVLKRRWDRPIWLAILASGAALLPLWPLMRAVGGFTGMFADPSVIAIQGLFSRMFGLTSVVFLLMALAAGLYGGGRSSSPPRSMRQPVFASRAGILLLLLFCLLPVPGFFMARWFTNAWADRYFTFTLIGLSIGFAILSYRLYHDKPWLPVGGLAALTLLAALEVRHHYSVPSYRAGTSVVVAEAVRATRKLPEGVEPLVVSGLFYLPLHRYSPPGVSARLLFLEEDPAEHFTVAARRLGVVQSVPIVTIPDVLAAPGGFYVYMPSHRLLEAVKRQSRPLRYVDGDMYYVMPAR